ncbi:MAG: hypothetical protein A2782_01645 [Candidatus Blackburnbacteria bacterium RIFCSPHIGHO2_01_FULL_43_15b]|uniref:Type II secretion system protein GspG C-terminal domain-containing protein n=1 Tax=Candidatus Blackburnbacteria bacterium RIFCSPHIGHO2_01_FULL_43_15b TaxID=1797513 RepID=A0A1G1UXJ1_9BACT|nr:MAG: hypothetical protein A2782_01645 [Candidatus Blackburnbacteria bacterium RIFCSPHIGHO2_01_FULL_43_15b]
MFKLKAQMPKTTAHSQKGFTLTAKWQRGFTLIELLVVITIIGLLAIAILVGLDPVQQFAKVRDANRLSATSQLGHAMEAYGITNSSDYVNESATWITDLVNSGEIKAVPPSVNYSVVGIVACAVNVQNNYCYDATSFAGTEPWVIFARLEAKANTSRCGAGTLAWAVYSSANGRGGIVCAGAPVVGNNTFLP